MRRFASDSFKAYLLPLVSDSWSGPELILMAVYSRVDQFRVLLLRISQDLRNEDVSRMRFLLVDLADARSDMGAKELFTELEVRGYVRADDLSFVSSLLRAISRSDLSRMVGQYSCGGIAMKGTV